MKDEVERVIREAVLEISGPEVEGRYADKVIQAATNKIMALSDWKDSMEVTPPDDKWVVVEVPALSWKTVGRRYGNTWAFPGGDAHSVAGTRWKDVL